MQGMVVRRNSPETDQGFRTRWRDRYLDGDLDTLVSTSNRWTTLRIAAMLLSSVGMFFVQFDGHVLVAGLLGICGAAQYLLAKSGVAHATILVTVIDFVSYCIASLFLPAVWPAATFWLGTSVAWQGIVSPRRVAAPILYSYWGLSSVALWWSGLELWWLVSLAVFLMVGLFIAYGALMRESILRTELEILDSVTSTGGVITRTDLRLGRCTQVYGDIETLLGFSRDEWFEVDLYELVHPADVADYWVDANQLLPGKTLDRTARLRHADGHYVWVRDVQYVSTDRKRNVIMRGYLTNVSEVEQAREQLHVQARTDILTGLANRHAHDEHMDMLAQRGVHFGLLIADLDRFKEVNDVLGHAAGDDVLQAIAKRLTRGQQPGMYISRLGGDEFAITVEGAETDEDLSDAVALVTNACTEPLRIAGAPVAVGVSVGSALSGGRLDRVACMRHADIAMYQAKTQGVVHAVFDASLERSSTQRLALTARLAHALQTGEIKLFMQPKVDIPTGRIVGAEGLARWDHPEYGRLTPGVFLDVALVSEHIRLFETVMVDLAIGQAGRLADLGCALPISVNVSVRSIRDPGFAAHILDRLTEELVPPQLLIIEITEDVVDDDSPAFFANLRALSEAGVAVSIDDFGTGYSSLRRVGALDVDELKIDRSFVASLGEDENDNILVESVIDLAGRLDMTVVAEGVETILQADTLERLGCTTAQGYLYAPALEPERFERLVRFDHVLQRGG